MSLSASAKARLMYQHETIHELIKSFSETQLKHRPNPDKWGVFENVAHLVSYQPVLLYRLKMIEQNENPAFERYAADNDPAFGECLQKSLKELLDDLSTQRFIIQKHIEQLSETILRRTGQHPKFGKMTVTQWIEFFLLHEAHHLFTIFALLPALQQVPQQ